MAAIVTGRSIAVDGLKETVRGLKKARPELGRAATKAGKQLTQRLILPEARSNWQRQNIKPSMASRAIVAAAGQTWAGIRVRYKTLPYGAGVAFGSKQHKQFRGWVGNQSTGAGGDYIVAPAVRKKGDTFGRQYMDEITKHMVGAIESQG